MMKREQLIEGLCAMIDTIVDMRNDPSNIAICSDNDLLYFNRVLDTVIDDYLA
jgi:hypothetical protein